MGFCTTKQRGDYMRNDRERTLTPEELNKTVSTMTASQKLQLEAIVNMITALLMSIQQAQATNKEVIK